PDGYTITPPTIGESLGNFYVNARDERPARLEEGGGKLISDLSYTLEPFLAGEYTIPALDITYAKIGGGETGSLSTEPLKIQVTSLLPDDAKLDPGPSRTVMNARAPGSWVGLAVIGAVGAAFAGATTTVILRRRRKRLAPGAADALAKLAREL